MNAPQDDLLANPNNNVVAHVGNDDVEAGASLVGLQRQFYTATNHLHDEKLIFADDIMERTYNCDWALTRIMDEHGEKGMQRVDDLFKNNGPMTHMKQKCAIIGTLQELNAANFMLILMKTNVHIASKLGSDTINPAPYNSYAQALAKLEENLKSIARPSKCFVFWLLCLSLGTKLMALFIEFAWMSVGFEGARIAIQSCIPSTLASIVNYWYDCDSDVWWDKMKHVAKWGSLYSVCTWTPLIVSFIPVCPDSVQGYLVMAFATPAAVLYYIHPNAAVDILSVQIKVESWHEGILYFILFVDTAYLFVLLIFGLGVVSKSIHGYSVPPGAESTTTMPGLWKEAWEAFRHGMMFLLSPEMWDGWTLFFFGLALVSVIFISNSCSWQWNRIKEIAEKRKQQKKPRCKRDKLQKTE